MTSFSAGPQALGYLYQARVALSLLLSAPDEAVLRVEALDDIELKDAISAGSLSLIQLKHHTVNATLTDADPDLWKSLRIWSDHATSKKFALENAKILLFTTAKIAAGTIPDLLGESRRDITEAETRLIKVATTSKNKILEPAFTVFRSLTPGQRKSLLSAIHIIGNYPDISGVKKMIDQQLRIAVRASHLVPFAERVEGWWNDKVILQLLAADPQASGGITGFALHEHVASVAATFQDENLPIDFEKFDLTDSHVEASKDRQYVRQLQAINASSRTIRKAIFDYHRAFHQRHRWLRDNLVLINELEDFEVRLRDEWERFFDHNYADIDTSDMQALINAGKEILKWAEMECNLRIRPRVEADYVRRGSFHILADKSPPDVCWHPQFNALMLKTLSAAIVP